MIVMKFGGTSVGAPDSLRNALGLVQQYAPGEVVVVVSALSGMTDLLARYAAEPAARALLAPQFVERHRQLAQQMGVDLAEFETLEELWRAQVDSDALRGVLEGVHRDRLLSHGERWSARLLAC